MENTATIQFTNLLVTGGLGFIGSHTIVQILLHTDLKLIIVDDLSHCYDDVLPRVKQIVSQKITSQIFDQRVKFHKINIVEFSTMENLFKQYRQKGEPLEGILHFASLKSVGYSYQHPLMYYQNNLIGAINLFKLMEQYNQCRHFIFSSSSSIYGHKNNVQQTDPKGPISPYSQTKYVVQLMMAQLARVHPQWRIISLRYFNPCGAHKSGLIGDEPNGYPNNLFPFIQEMIMGKRQKLTVFGNDYDTPDGTCVRDYVHISDLANAHLFALNKLIILNDKKNFDYFNLGKGHGYSVLQVIKGYETALGHPIKWEFGPRRGGDATSVYANPGKVNRQWGWKTTKTLKDMCQDSLNFVRKRMEINQKKNLSLN